jgi:hypothetical protein
MPQCGRLNCVNEGKSSCSGCGVEQYCGSDCQKLDWKTHKPMCPFLKKFFKKVQPFREANRVISEILTSNKVNNARVLEHLMVYAEFQFGSEITGIGYRERDGQRRDNWEIDINILFAINSTLIDIYGSDESLGIIERDEKISPHAEKLLCILNPWLVHLDPDTNNQTNLLNFNQENDLLGLLFHTEQVLGMITISRNQLDIAEGHCHRCLAYSRRITVEGMGKTTMIFTAFRTYIDLRRRQYLYPEAVTLAEDAYNLVVSAYDPVHPQV